MINLEIPYSAENNRIDRTAVKNELEALRISTGEKAEVFDAIYYLHPKVVSFDAKNLKEILLLEEALIRLGVPFRRIKD